jgi:cobalt-zinc-cadmium efflux system protein
MTNGNKYKYGLILNSSFAIGELAIGLFTGSLALVSDAVHNFSDSLTLIIAWIADHLSLQKANKKNTYGLKRAKILGSLFNSVILLLIAFYIFFQAYHKFQEPEQVQGGVIAIVSFVGFLINTFVAILFKDPGSDLNKKAAFLNMALDALASLMAMVGGVVILFTQSKLIDPLISLLIGVLLLHGAWQIIKDAVEILLEKTPEGISHDDVKKEIIAHSCVKEVVDLHVWSLTEDYTILTSVVNVNKDCIEHIDKLIEELKHDLENKFGINHLTIETRVNAMPHID